MSTRRTASFAVIRLPDSISQGRTSAYFHSAATQGDIGWRGIETRAGTYETDQRGVFAAGNAVRGKGLVVRSVADGKEAAMDAKSKLEAAGAKVELK